MILPVYSSAERTSTSPKLRIFEPRLDEIAVGAQVVVDFGHLVIGLGIGGHVGRDFALFRQPLLAPAVQQADVFVTVVFEQPEGIGREPVVVIAIEDDVRLWRNSGIAQQRLEFFFGGDVAQRLVLKLRLPVEGDCAGDMPGFVLGGVHVHFDQAHIVFVVGDPLRAYQCIGHDFCSP